MKNMNGNWYSLRWLILNRDKFTCQYCGSRAPDVILHIDHKVAKASGGTDNPENLITACSACNIGKNLTPLSIPTSETAHLLGRLERKKSSPLQDEIVTYLKTLPGGASGTQIAETLQHHRATIAKILAQTNQFQKIGKKGRDVLYTVKCLM